jgi:hypothetical protein
MKRKLRNISKEDFLKEVAIRTCIEQNDVEELQKLLSSTDINFRVIFYSPRLTRSRRKSIFRWTVESRKTECLRVITESCKSTECEDYENEWRNAFASAVKDNYPEGVEVILTRWKGVSPQLIQRALYLACCSDSVDVLECLARFGAQVDFRDQFCSSSPLGICMLEPKRRYRSFRKLLDLGANPNGPPSSSDSYLHYACSVRFMDMIRDLLTAGADINETHRSSGTVFDGIYGGHPVLALETVECLLTYGAEVKTEVIDRGIRIFQRDEPRYAGVIARLQEYRDNRNSNNYLLK